MPASSIEIVYRARSAAARVRLNSRQAGYLGDAHRPEPACATPLPAGRAKRSIDPGADNGGEEATQTGCAAAIAGRDVRRHRLHAVDRLNLGLPSMDGLKSLDAERTEFVARLSRIVCDGSGVHAPTVRT